MEENLIETYRQEKAPRDFDPKKWLRRRIHEKHQEAKGWAEMNAKAYPGSLEMLHWWRREADKLERALDWIDKQDNG